MSYAGWNPYFFECRPATARLEPDGKVASFPRKRNVPLDAMKNPICSTHLLTIVGCEVLSA
jgi:hypothetical protein